jgi:uncharacterized protein YjbI with pentapeptide repeats
VNREQPHPQLEQPYQRRKAPSGWRYYSPAEHQLERAALNSWRLVKDNAVLVGAFIILFGVLIIGIINTYIATQSEEAQQQIQNDNAQEQHELEHDNAQVTALQTYLNDMGRLILSDSSPLRKANARGEVSSLARAKTLTVLSELDPVHKRILLQFLQEEKLINAPNPTVSLSGADLSHAQLSSVDEDHNRFFLKGTNLAGSDLSAAQMRFAALGKADLHEADLRKASLYSANLSHANLNGALLEDSNLNKAELYSATLKNATLPNAKLRGADLSSADLSNADLNDADLSGAYLNCSSEETSSGKEGKACAELSGANLTGANLSGADLSGADLSNAYLAGAILVHADLSNANLSHAIGLTKNELEQPNSLRNATMPDGSVHD